MKIFVIYGGQRQNSTRNCSTSRLNYDFLTEENLRITKFCLYALVDVQINI